MRFRKLRIAWSVGCGIACVLLIVSWVLSYWFDIGIFRNGYRRVVIATDYGDFLLQTWIDDSFTGKEWWGIGLHATRPPHITTFGIQILPSPPGDHYLRINGWIPSLALGILSIAPWLLRRFTLRTLLIATTLVAVALGAIVLAARK